MNADLFSEIAQKCPRKKVISCCKKLSKKCSYKSGASMEILCELAYWLYIYGFSDDVMAVAAGTHEIPFVRDYRVWTWIFSIWGLEIRILRERGCHEQADRLISEMDEYYLLPVKEGETREDREAAEQTRRSRELFSYPICADQAAIEAEESKAWANKIRLTALYRMIGDGATGLYPLMNRDMDLIESKIQEYMEALAAVD